VDWIVKAGRFLGILNMGGKGVLKLDENAIDCAVIVAHPDDETLWAGGTILSNPQASWTIVSLCRKSDADRAPKFRRAVERLGASGFMGDLDDGPEQRALATREVEDSIISLLPSRRFDLVITHSVNGEYTRHLRHEETAGAVLGLWKRGQLAARELWMFAYEDGGKQYLPRAIAAADRIADVTDEIWMEKYRIITEVYGFGEGSFEATTCPRREAFWCLRSAEEVNERFCKGEVR